MRFAARPVIHQPHCALLTLAASTLPVCSPRAPSRGHAPPSSPATAAFLRQADAGRRSAGLGGTERCEALLLAVGCLSCRPKNCPGPGLELWQAPPCHPWLSRPCASSRRRLPATMRGSIHQRPGVSFAPPPTRLPNRLTCSIRCIPAIRCAMYSPVDGAFPLSSCFPRARRNQGRQTQCNAHFAISTHTHTHCPPTPVRCRRSLIAPPIVHLPWHLCLRGLVSKRVRNPRRLCAMHARRPQKVIAPSRPPPRAAESRGRASR
jgi:hypothetical protein